MHAPAHLALHQHHVSPPSPGTTPSPRWPCAIPTAPAPPQGDQQCDGSRRRAPAQHRLPTRTRTRGSRHRTPHQVMLRRRRPTGPPCSARQPPPALAAGTPYLELVQRLLHHVGYDEGGAVFEMLVASSSLRLSLPGSARARRPRPGRAPGWPPCRAAPRHSGSTTPAARGR